LNKKVIANLFFSIMLYWSAAALLYRDSLFLSSLKNPGGGSLFSGWSLYLLAFSLILLGTISLLAARLWSSSEEIPSGWDHLLGPGGVLRRYWYLLLLFLAVVGAAFFQAERISSPDNGDETGLALQSSVSHPQRL
jgi:hypothetical protein